MIKPIKNIIDALISREHTWKLALLHQWPLIMGDMIRYASIEKIDNDVITITVSDSCWLQELYLLSPMLLEKINQNLDQPRIKRLLFKRARLLKQKTHVLPQQPSLVTTVTIPSHDRAALETITNQPLRSALEAFLIRCCRERS